MIEEPQVILTTRYFSKMGSPLPAVARFGLTDGSRDTHAVCKEFDYRRRAPARQRVAVEESVLEAAREKDAQIVFLQERETGDVYEFPLSAFHDNALYETTFGEGMFYVELKDAVARWPDLGDDFYTNDTFWYP